MKTGNSHETYPLAAMYRSLVAERDGLPPATDGFEGVAERNPDWDPFTERHLHCVWFDDRLRPRDLKTAAGEEVTILHPGHWNHGKGPDFHHGEWIVGDRRVQGDVEVHIRPLDWRHHGHASDPAYGQVRLHVTYEPGELPRGELPADCEQVSLKASLDRRSHFFFDAIDPGAYPWQRESTRSGLRALFSDLPEAEQGRMLEAAGQERLRRKALRMHRAIRAVGEEQALYAALLRGLGYRHNADTAEALARALPADTLRALARNDVRTGYALLLGCAGLLPADADTPGFPSAWAGVRLLWDRWWPHQGRFLARALDPEFWRLDQGRPGNHPWRRLWAAAAWGSGPNALIHRFEPRNGETDPDWLRRVREEVQVASPNVGERVVGPLRGGTLVLNALVPWRLCRLDAPPGEDFWTHLPSEPLNSRSRRAGHALFGPDVHPRLFRGGLRRQGLLQFHEDFGL